MSSKQLYIYSWRCTILSINQYRSAKGIVPLAGELLIYFEGMFMVRMEILIKMKVGFYHKLQLYLIKHYSDIFSRGIL